MRYILFLVFFLPLFCVSQEENEERLNAMISEANDLLSIYEVDADKYSFDCPPKLSRSSADSLELFLELLLTDSEREQEIFLESMMKDNCKPYYQVTTLDDHYRPIYSKLIKEYSSSEWYEKLPIALSASNPNLQIDGDKTGLWQLSYINARRFGLAINSYVDERYDVTRSTYAAIQYFMFLEERFPNRPLLVISAFYTSVPYVNKMLSRTTDNSDAAFLKQINDELRSFLIYVLSWDEWMNNFKSVKRPDIISKAQKKWKNVELKDTVEIQILADFLGLNASLLKKMNPIWIGAEVTPNTLKHPFYLPEDKADFIHAHYDGFVKFQQDLIAEKEKELLELKKRLANDIPDPDKYMAITYRVRSGDVLGLIAQRNGVKVSSIKKWNKLSSDRINIGQELVLYVPKTNGKVIEEEENEDNKIEIISKEPKPGKGSYTTYVVKNGESLWIIARKFPGVSSENIMEWNGISDKIKPGQELKIYSK
jgi:membrane-bound lytic murein transglycosylase D